MYKLAVVFFIPLKISHEGVEKTNASGLVYQLILKISNYAIKITKRCLVS